ncbi:MAG: hypothetical protein HQM10_06035 [Candidatus Riflebacteria bacterium]|nr:hypothetical protein [Candidatus Riflebacteria bacterium]
MKLYRVAFIIGLFFCLQAAVASELSFDGLAPNSKHFGLQKRVFQIFHQRWVVCETYENYAGNPTTENMEKYIVAMQVFDKQSVDLGKTLVSLVDEPGREAIQLVSAIYKSMDAISRQALYKALGTFKSDIFMSGMAGNSNARLPLSEEEFREYFPGYGYTEPGYKYRKGREVSRESKGFFSQDTEETYVSSFTVELNVTLDILNLLRQMFAQGKISNLQEKGQITSNVNGVPTIVFKVSFVVGKKIFTKTSRRYEIIKTWFELSRAKDNGWGNTGPWEVCGQTYELINEPTGDAPVVVSLNE